MPAEADNLQEVRDRLPEVKTWTYEHDGAQMAVSLALGHCWPDVLVIVEQPESGLRTAGLFGEDDRLVRFTIEVVGEDADITSAALRRPMLGTLRSWHRVGREVARQILAGVPAESIAFDGRDATAAMRELMYADGRAIEPKRHRGAKRETLIRSVASGYRRLVEGGDPHPRIALAETLGLSEAHIGRLLTAARRERNGQPALLGPALRGKAGEAADPADSSPPGRDPIG